MLGEDKVREVIPEGEHNIILDLVREVEKQIRNVLAARTEMGEPVQEETRTALQSLALMLNDIESLLTVNESIEAAKLCQNVGRLIAELMRIYYDTHTEFLAIEADEKLDENIRKKDEDVSRLAQKSDCPDLPNAVISPELLTLFKKLLKTIIEDKQIRAQVIEETGDEAFPWKLAYLLEKTIQISLFPQNREQLAREGEDLFK